MSDGPFKRGTGAVTRKILLDETSSALCKCRAGRPSCSRRTRGIREKNGACVVEWQIGSAGDIGMAARAMLLVAIMKQKAFAELRTKQQLGYVVQTSTRNHLGVAGIRILVQSKTMQPDQVAQRIDAFLTMFRRDILASVDVETYKASLQQKLTEPDKSVYETFSRLRRAFLAPGICCGSAAQRSRTRSTRYLLRISSPFSTRTLQSTAPSAGSCG